jgi:predicted metal-dependent phosphoesterase TrpH
MIKTDFHCHTIYSRDSLVRVEDLPRICNKKGLHKLVITDHNTIEGAVIAHNSDPERFIIGEEILTQQGEILGIFVKEEIPPNLSAQETIKLLRSQGAFISVSHPCDKFRKGHWQVEDLNEIMPGIDAIEVFNSRCLLPHFNLDAIIYAQQHHLLGTVGSDAHSLGEIGIAALLLPNFTDTASLKQALTLSEPKVRPSGPWVHFITRYAVWRWRVRSRHGVVAE